YAACVESGTANTWSSSSSVLPFVSRTKSKMRTQIIQHHAAYQPKAPCGLNARTSEGQVMDRTKFQNQSVAVAKDMPMSRMYSGNASAEYVNGTGPS
ncbi:hypothetical protein K503DRAFT_648347, partial [Rhizopogon vinicolor AM-OR11-026]